MSAPYAYALKRAHTSQSVLHMAQKHTVRGVIVISIVDSSPEYALSRHSTTRPGDKLDSRHENRNENRSNGGYLDNEKRPAAAHA